MLYSLGFQNIINVQFPMSFMNLLIFTLQHFSRRRSPWLGYAEAAVPGSAGAEDTLSGV